MRRCLLALAAASLLLVACGDDDDTGDGTTTTAPGSTTTAPEGGGTLPGDGSTDGTLPGERVDLFPREGAMLMVVAVPIGDTLNVRSGPGTDFEVLLELEPITTGIEATGHNRLLDDGSLWAEIDYDGTTGWASTAFLLQAGATDDITAELYPDPADRPGAETLVALAEVVAAERASEDPPSRIRVVGMNPVDDLQEVHVDVVGLGDDALGGERLHVLAEPLPDGETFQVRAVERTLLCSRGVTDDGLCV